MNPESPPSPSVPLHIAQAKSQILSSLLRARRVLITTHVRPDGDALGTCAAMVLALRARGIDSHVLLLSHLPQKYAFIFQDHAIVHHDVEQGWVEEFDLSRFDAMLVCDTGTWSQLPLLQERQSMLPRPILVLDHHLTQQEWADVKLVDTTASAAGEIAHAMIVEMGVPLDASLATCLFAAIASDTGWFQFSNTTPRTMRLAAELMEAGVDTDRMYQLLFQNERHQRLAIQTRALQSLELLANHRLAVMTLRRQDLIDCDADPSDTENLINIPLQVRTVEISVLISEPKRLPGSVRVSFRSKGQVDVARLAERFGGGGHARASGAKFDQSVEQVREVLIKALREELGA